MFWFVSQAETGSPVLGFIKKMLSPRRCDRSVQEKWGGIGLGLGPGLGIGRFVQEEWGEIGLGLGPGLGRSVQEE